MITALIDYILCSYMKYFSPLYLHNMTFAPLIINSNIYRFLDITEVMALNISV